MIKNAEDNSKAAKRRIWENYAGEEEHETVEEADRKSMNEERKVSYEQVRFFCPYRKEYHRKTLKRYIGKSVGFFLHKKF